MSTLIIHNALIVTPAATKHGWLEIDGDTIVSVNDGELPAAVAGDATVIDAGGRLLMPGAIDEHVHFREPGMTAKATIAGESRAAVAGGVTSFIDMPNVVPPTVSVDLIDEKKTIAARDSVANYGFYIGATPQNIDLLAGIDYSGIAGVKLFIGATTGSLVVDDAAMLDRLFSTVKVPIAVHAEDNRIINANRARLLSEAGEGADDLPVELHPAVRSRQACVEATRQAIGLAERHHARLHIMHVSTADELELLAGVDRALITAETCPQYLLFDRGDYTTRGTRIKCNPAIKEEADRRALVEAVATGVIDTIGTDHAPHLAADKQGGALKAASGMPMIQFMLPLMLDLFDPATVACRTAATPARIFGITDRGIIAPGMKADLTLVSKLDNRHAISDTDVISKCGWTPAVGLTTGHRVDLTLVNGTVAFSLLDGVSAVPRPRVMPLRFSH